MYALKLLLLIFYDMFYHIIFTESGTCGLVKTKRLKYLKSLDFDHSNIQFTESLISQSFHTLFFLIQNSYDNNNDKMDHLH